ncbi:hypothetical protein NUSPORA_01603 [Nucleospora cyclopteri]
MFLTFHLISLILTDAYSISFKPSDSVLGVKSFSYKEIHLADYSIDKDKEINIEEDMNELIEQIIIYQCDYKSVCMNIDQLFVALRKIISVSVQENGDQHAMNEIISLLRQNENKLAEISFYLNQKNFDDTKNHSKKIFAEMIDDLRKYAIVKGVLPIKILLKLKSVLEYYVQNKNTLVS